ncbi:hypothetical protein GCM10027436_75870 [Actinophytocola sediminis]
MSLRISEVDTMITVNGVLRTSVTYADANARIIGIGLTRIATRIVPQITEPIAEKKVSWTVSQNAPRRSYSSRKSNTSYRTLAFPA